MDEVPDAPVNEFRWALSSAAHGLFAAGFPNNPQLLARLLTSVPAEHEHGHNPAAGLVQHEPVETSMEAGPSDSAPMPTIRQTPSAADVLSEIAFLD